MSADILAAHALVRSYSRPGSSGVLSVLKGASLSLKPAETLAIVGPSGSGKSTLLHILAGLDTPDSGQVIVSGKELTALDEDARASLRADSIGIVLQRAQLLVQCTALDNVLLPTLVGSYPNKGALKERAMGLLEGVGLADFSQHRPAELSAGQRQRVALARALISSPAVILADEPTGALDRETSEGLMDLLESLRERLGMSLLVVTHDAALVARADRALTLVDGVLEPSDS